jgi:hypothetical protein
VTSGRIREGTTMTAAEEPSPTLGEVAMTDGQPDEGEGEGKDSVVSRSRRRRSRGAQSGEAESPRKTSRLSAIARLLQEPLTGAPSPEASEREAEEELRAMMSPAFEKLMEAVPEVSSPEEAAEVLAAHGTSTETEGRESESRREFVPEDSVEMTVQYRLRRQFVRPPAVGDHERGMADRVPVGASSDAGNGDRSSDSAGYIAGFAERMRERSEQDPG